MNDETNPLQRIEQAIGDLDLRIGRAENDLTKLIQEAETASQRRYTELQESIKNQRRDGKDQNDRISYQEAADWVRMSNTVMWSLGSIYIVVALLVLNGSMQHSEKWRLAIGLAVAFLAITWLVTDIAYGRSTAAARRHLTTLEAAWRNRDELTVGFYNNQHELRNWISVVSILYRATALVLILLGLIVASPSLRQFLWAKWQFISPIWQPLRRMLT